jgi:type IV secretory pathway TrbL component
MIALKMLKNHHQFCGRAGATPGLLRDPSHKSGLLLGQSNTADAHPTAKRGCMHRLFAIVLLSGAAILGCGGNTKAGPAGAEEAQARTRATTAYESEATGGSVLGGGTSETATGTLGVPEHKTWSTNSGGNKSVTGANVSNTGHSGTPAGTQGAPQPK